MDHERSQHGGHHFDIGGPAIGITVRRQYLYDDSFVALSPGEAPDLRGPIRVRMVNWAGANEHGVDGGGIFRLSLLLFCSTANQLKEKKGGGGVGRESCLLVWIMFCSKYSTNLLVSESF